MAVTVVLVDGKAAPCAAAERVPQPPVHAVVVAATVTSQQVEEVHAVVVHTRHHAAAAAAALDPWQCGVRRSVKAPAPARVVCLVFGLALHAKVANIQLRAQNGKSSYSPVLCTH